MGTTLGVWIESLSDIHGLRGGDDSPKAGLLLVTRKVIGVWQYTQ